MPGRGSEPRPCSRRSDRLGSWTIPRGVIMPLQDHFNPPLSRTHPWRGFHSAWAAAIARLLNRGVLPAGYYAIPNVELDGPVEIDVAALREKLEAKGADASQALTPWTLPEPSLVATLDFPPLDLIEVQVLYEEDG